MALSNASAARAILIDRGNGILGTSIVVGVLALLAAALVTTGTGASWGPEYLLGSVPGVVLLIGWGAYMRSLHHAGAAVVELLATQTMLLNGIAHRLPPQ
jgi:hypothetical protein